ncbi:MAG TPA: protein-tyrosine phosphatase family protein [Rhizobacter sp.]
MIQNLQPKGSLELAFGAITGTVTGGPFDYSPQLSPETLTVKLAKEINLPCDVDLPIRDFSTPNIQLAELALRSAIRAIKNGRPVYVGCMAGQGRTGLFLALLVKVAQDYELRWGENPEDAADLLPPVEYVRKHYYAHAVETAGQYAFVNQFDTSDVVEFVRQIQPPKPLSPLARFARAAFALGRALIDAGRAVLTGRPAG